MIKLNNKGQTLIETVLAISVATIIISAMALVIINSISNATFSRNQNLATQYAQQGMDLLRQQSESDWNTFYGYSASNYCFGPPPLNLTSSGCSSANINGQFLRMVQIEKPGVGCTVEKATVTVSWNDGKCGGGPTDYCHLVNLESCFTQTNTTTWP